MNASHPDFNRTVFAALKYTTKNEFGEMEAHFEEFILCSEAEAQEIEGYIPIDQTGSYY